MTYLCARKQYHGVMLFVLCGFEGIRDLDSEFCDVFTGLANAESLGSGIFVPGGP